MSKSRLLVVDDDSDIAYLLQMYFQDAGFQVETAMRGADVVHRAKDLLPDLILLDVMLPDIDGYEICRQLCINHRTSHIPVIFLTQKDERNDILLGLELGAYDYCTKPFDIEALRLRILNAIVHTQREVLTDSRSRLPTGSLIDKHLRRIRQESNSILLNIHINNFEPFEQVYGAMASRDVLSFTAALLSQVLDGVGNLSDFIGHVSDNHFLVITTEERAPAIKRHLKQRFDSEIQTHYTFLDRQQGFMRGDDQKEYALMSLSVSRINFGEYRALDPRAILKLVVSRIVLEKQE
jgi:PleD family two-component response regulator